MGHGKGLAITALALGVIGLFTAGGLVLGSLLGLVLAAAVLIRRLEPGRAIAWAAIAVNVLALLTIIPIGAAVWLYWHRPQTFSAEDDALPEPAQSRQIAFVDPPSPSPSATHAPVAPTPAPGMARAGPAAAAGVTTPRHAALPPMPTPAAEPPSSAERDEVEAGSSPPVRVGAGIPEPSKTRHVNPVYPREAIAARLQGVVVLECTISAQGKVIAVRTLRSAPLLEAAAVDAVRQWEYAPTLLNGRPVPVTMTVTVKFTLR